MAFHADRNFFLRVASALVGLPLVGLAIFAPTSLPFAVLTLVAVAAGMIEYTGLLLADRGGGERAALVAVGVSFAAAGYHRPDLGLVLVMIAALVTGVIVLVSTRHSAVGAAAHLGIAGFGPAYVGLLVALALLRRDVSHGPLWVVSAIAVTFGNDTGAYFVGRSWGRRKLAPGLSPGKTVEGAIGGLLTGIALMLAAHFTFFPAMTLLDALVIGLGAGLLGPSGDLLESALKRSVGAKDSGKSIPGHGGILDRVDALLFVGAFVYLYARHLR